MPVLVFVHGSGATSDHWRFQTRYFRDSVALDLPGHADNGPGRSRVIDYVNWVRDEIHKRGIPDPVLVGHSLGGAIALTYALEYPGELCGLGLIGTGARLKVLPSILEGLRTGDMDTARMAMDYAFKASASAEEKAHDLEACGRVRCQVTWGDFSSCNDFDVMKTVHQIQEPAVAVCGTEDRLTPPKYSRFLCEKMAHARLELIEGAGHMVMVEQPVAFNQALARFVAELSGRATDAAA